MQGKKQKSGGGAVDFGSKKTKIRKKCNTCANVKCTGTGLYQTYHLYATRNTITMSPQITTTSTTTLASTANHGPPVVLQGSLVQPGVLAQLGHVGAVVVGEHLVVQDRVRHLSNTITHTRKTRKRSLNTRMIQ